MDAISKFHSDEARDSYCRLYDSAVAASHIPVAESDVETSFGRTHLLIAGEPSNPPLIALHALAMSSTMWLPLLHVLAARHRVIMIDVIGQASKSIASKPITRTAHIVGWLDETLRALAVEGSPMICMSMGSCIGANYAMAYPQRVERLALIAPVGLVSNQRPGWLLRAGYANYVRPTPARTQSFFASLVCRENRSRLVREPWASIVQQYVCGATGFRAPLNAVRPMRCDLRQLSEVGIPVTIAIGREESLHDGPTAAARFRRVLPHARIELVDGANHVIPVDQPAIVDQILTDFLS